MPRFHLSSIVKQLSGWLVFFQCNNKFCIGHEHFISHCSLDSLDCSFNWRINSFAATSSLVSRGALCKVRATLRTWENGAGEWILGVDSVPWHATLFFCVFDLTANITSSLSLSLSPRQYAPFFSSSSLCPCHDRARARGVSRNPPSIRTSACTCVFAREDNGSHVVFHMEKMRERAVVAFNVFAAC